MRKVHLIVHERYQGEHQAADATDTWTLSFWAKLDGNTAFYKRVSATSPQSTTLTSDGNWHYYTIPLNLGENMSLSDTSLYFSVQPQSTLYINGVSLVAGGFFMMHEAGLHIIFRKQTSATGTNDEEYCFGK